MSIFAAIAIAFGVALSAETWTEKQVLKARFPRKLVRKGYRLPLPFRLSDDNLATY